MPQAIQDESEPKQQGLTHLHPKGATGGASREFALHRREDALHQSGAPIESGGNARRISARTPRMRQVFFPPFGGDHTPRPQLLTDILSRL